MRVLRYPTDDELGQADERRQTGIIRAEMSAFDTGWAVVKMATVWPCKCGHQNKREFAKPGQQVIFDVCDECGEMPKDMPTFIDDGKGD